MTAPDPLLTPDEVSAWTTLSVKTLRNLRSKGGGPAYVKVAGRVAYERTTVAKWLKANTHQRTPAPSRSP